MSRVSASEELVIRKKIVQKTFLTIARHISQSTISLRMINGRQHISLRNNLWKIPPHPHLVTIDWNDKLIGWLTWWHRLSAFQYDCVLQNRERFATLRRLSNEVTNEEVAAGSVPFQYWGLITEPGRSGGSGTQLLFKFLVKALQLYSINW